MTASQVYSAEATTSDPILRRGDRGTAVIELQKLLNSKGASLTVDGIFGALTETLAATANSGSNPE